MNKRVFGLLILLGVVLTVVSFKFYKDSKKEALNEYLNYLTFKQKIEEIKYLKNKYFSKISIPCKKEENPQKIIYTCLNLDKNKFQQISKIFKQNVKLNRFTIEKKDKTIDLKVEILK